jgi:hypothetical protein
MERRGEMCFETLGDVALLALTAVGALYERRPQPSGWFLVTGCST